MPDVKITLSVTTTEYQMLRTELHLLKEDLRRQQRQGDAERLPPAERQALMTREAQVANFLEKLS